MKLLRPVLLLFAVAAVLSGAACNFLLGGSPQPTSSEITREMGSPTSPSSARTDSMTPTQTLPPVGQNMRVTGEIAATVDGETRTWHMVLSPGIGGVLVNSATWSDQFDGAGYLVADLSGHIFDEGFEQPISSLYLEFPFTRGVDSLRVRIPGQAADRPSASVLLEWPSARYRMTKGTILVRRTEISGEFASLGGTVTGVLVPVSEVGADGEGAAHSALRMQGAFDILRATAKSALPGGRPPEGG